MWSLFYLVFDVVGKLFEEVHNTVIPAAGEAGLELEPRVLSGFQLWVTCYKASIQLAAIGHDPQE